MVYCAANWYCFCLTEQTQRGRERKRRWDAPARGWCRGSCWHAALRPGASSRRPQCHLHTRGSRWLCGSDGDLFVNELNQALGMNHRHKQEGPFSKSSFVSGLCGPVYADEGAPFYLCNAQMWHHLCDNCPAGTWLCPSQALGCSWTSCTLALTEGKNVIFVFLANKKYLKSGKPAWLGVGNITWAGSGVWPLTSGSTPQPPAAFPKGVKSLK